MKSPAPCETRDRSLRRGDFLVASVPFYYGWIMLLVAMVALIATTPGQTVGVSVFTESFAESLNISETQLTGAYGLGTLLACLPLSLVGAMMDRYGIRRVMTATVLLLGMACVFASRVESLPMLFAAFFMLRLFGQGALSLLASNTSAMWFHRRLGAVTGFTSVGVILTMGQAPWLIRQAIEVWGWRDAYVALGVLVWLMMLPLLALVYRNRPEDIGASVDGVSGPPDTQADSPSLSLNDIDLTGAFATHSYWVMITVYTSWAMIGTALIFNAHRLFDERGLSVPDADIALSRFFIAVAAMQVCGGLLADRVPLNRLAFLAVSGMAGSLAVLLFAPPDMMTAGYVAFGGSQGLLGAVGATLWVRYYGRGHVGKIRGTAQTASVAGSSLGPFVMGWCFDSLGTYDVSLWAFFILLTALAPAALAATSPCVSKRRGAMADA